MLPAYLIAIIEGLPPRAAAVILSQTYHLGLGVAGRTSGGPEAERGRNWQTSGVGWWGWLRRA